MAAGLLQYDWMMSSKEKPWHGIGTVVRDAPTSEDAIRLAKLDWDVIQYPINANGIEIPDYFANIRSDTNTSLGIVKDRYKIVQNIEAFDFVDGIVGNKHIECHYETAGRMYMPNGDPGYPSEEDFEITDVDFVLFDGEEEITDPVLIERADAYITDWLYDNPDVFPPPEPDWY